MWRIVWGGYKAFCFHLSVTTPSRLQLFFMFFHPSSLSPFLTHSVTNPLFPSQSLQRLLNKKNEDGDLDLEEETRQLMILQLQSYARDSIGEIDMIKQVRMRV